MNTKFIVIGFLLAAFMALMTISFSFFMTEISNADFTKIGISDSNSDGNIDLYSIGKNADVRWCWSQISVN